MTLSAFTLLKNFIWSSIKILFTLGILFKSYVIQNGEKLGGGEGGIIIYLASRLTDQKNKKKE